MRKSIKRTVRKANAKLQRVREGLEVNLTLPIPALLAEVGWQVEQLAAQAGLRIMQCAMEHEVEELAGERYRHEAATEGQRWGRQPGYVMFGGAKVPLERPRVRSKTSTQEVPLESYRNFQQDVRLEQAVMDQMALRLSTRNYEPSIRAVCEAYGVKKSSVSRRFIDGSRKALDELMNRDLRPLDLCVLFLDGIERGGQCLIVALGLDSAGQKHALGLWQGATENATVCRELLGNLIQRGVDPERKYLFLLDGSKALGSAAARMFAGSAIQRCQWHKRCNVTGHLPENCQSDYDRRMRNTYNLSNYTDAKAELQAIVAQLEGMNPSAARSLEEGLEETLTLHRLGIPELLRQSLRTTNLIESCLSRVDQLTHRVTRWRPGDQTLRWFATALLLAEKKFRTVKGYRSLSVLLRALGREGTAQATEKVA